MSKEAMKLALEALRKSMQGNLVFDEAMESFKALEEALAKQEQGEPVAYLNPDDVCADTAFRWCKIDEFTQPVYTTPQPAQKPLTDEQIGDIAALYYPRWQGHEGFARAIEAAHGIKENT
jgi:IS4 transposase